MVPVGERPGDDAAGTACDEPRQRSPELAVCQPPGPVADRGDAVGAVVALAVVVDPGDEAVEAGVGGAAGQDPADSTGLGAGAVLKAGEQVPGSGRLELFQDGDGAGGGFADAPGGGHAGGVVLAFEGQAAYLPPVGRARGVPLDRQAVPLQVLELAVPGA